MSTEDDTPNFFDSALDSTLDFEENGDPPPDEDLNPALVRAAFDTKSDKVGELATGTRVHVLETRSTPDGAVRACGRPLLCLSRSRRKRRAAAALLSQSHRLWRCGRLQCLGEPEGESGRSLAIARRLQ